MDYATIEMLHAYGGFKGEVDDTILQHLISVASQMVDQYCGRVFGIEAGAVAVTRTFTIANGLLPESGEAALYFPDDIYTVTTIPTLAAGVTLTWMPDRPPYYGVIRDSGSWEDPTTIAGYWAYSETPPVAIIQATLRLAVWLYRQRQTTDGDRAIITPQGILLAPTVLPRDVEFILAPFRRARLP